MSEMTETDQEFFDIGTSFKKPIPGSSLTRSPEDSYTWEKPPVITDSSEAARFFFMKLIEPKVYNAVLDSVEEGTPLMDLSQMLMYQAFTDGIINPDMMLIMVEPVVYIEENRLQELLNPKIDSENIEIPKEIVEQVEEAEMPERSSLLGEQ